MPDFPLTDLLFSLIGPIILALFMLVAIYRSIKAILFILRPKEPEWVKDVSDQSVPLPQGGEYLEGELWNLGFEPIAILEVKYAGIGKPTHSWVYRTREGSVYAEVAPLAIKEKPALVQFMTYFPNNAMILTRYPLGENISTPKFQSHFAMYSLEAAYKDHWKRVEEWEKIYGDTIKVRGLEDLKKTDDIFRQYHRRRDYRRILTLHFAVLVASTILMITCILSVLSLGIDDYAFKMPVYGTFFGALGLEIIVAAQVEDRMKKPGGAVDKRANLAADEAR